MLLICQPKSTSTSLTQTIAHIAKISSRQGIGKINNHDKQINDFFEIQKQHGPFYERNYKYFENWINRRDCIHKDHIFPIQKHIDILKEINKNFVILLRDPVESIASYEKIKKMIEREKSNNSKSYLNKRLDNYKKINLEIFLNDFERFNKLWRESEIESSLIIDYKEVINNFTETIKKILNHYNIEIPGNIDKYFLLDGIGTHGQNTNTSEL